LFQDGKGRKKRQHQALPSIFGHCKATAQDPELADMEAGVFLSIPMRRPAGGSHTKNGEKALTAKF
jgi:hypothetical protein